MRRGKGGQISAVCHLLFSSSHLRRNLHDHAFLRPIVEQLSVLAVEQDAAIGDGLAEVALPQDLFWSRLGNPWKPFIKPDPAPAGRCP